jgi:hypothetical protein
MSFGNAGTIDDIASAVRGDNIISSRIEKEIQSDAMRCSKGNKASCIVLGAGSIASVLWRIDKVLIDIASRGRTSKSRKATRILKKAQKILKDKNKNSSSTQRNNRSSQSKSILILSERNINGHQVMIYVAGNNKAYIKTDGRRLEMTRNGGFRSMAKILSLLPKDIRNSRLVRKKITSAKIQWRNNNR